MNKKGFTLIEILIYVGLVSIFLTGIVYFMIDTLKIREKHTSQYLLTQQSQDILERLSYELNYAQSYDAINNTSIEYTNSSGLSSRIYLQSGRLYLDNGAVNAMTNNTVTVSDFAFTDLSSTNASSISVAFTLGNNVVTQDFVSSYSLKNTGGSSLADTCTLYCQSLSYSSGICRQNSNQCSNNGETYESGGDQYCTTVPSDNTCCCN